MDILNSTTPNITFTESNGTSLLSGTDPIPLDGINAITNSMDWCFNLITYYETIYEESDPKSLEVLPQLYSYSTFSFWINGVVTTLLTIFGFMGNVLLLYQIRSSAHFSKRLAGHLIMLCLWDMALLLCCFLTYGVTSLYYGMTPFYGIVAYILYFFQPTASFCVTGTIWQVLAVTMERYMAVSRPLERRIRKTYFPLKVICFCIILGAMILNFTSAPFERSLQPCYEFSNQDILINTQIVPTDIVSNRYYAVLFHFVPDLLFRAPCPLIAIAVFTIQTLRLCNKRQVGEHVILNTSKKNVPFMLTALNIKFVCCNTLYMVNTFFMEVMGFGSKTGTNNQIEMDQYITSLYLTDLSNLLLALHGSTNWLIFYNWPTISKSMGKYERGTTKNSKSCLPHLAKDSVIDNDIVNTIKQRFNEVKDEIGLKLAEKLFKVNPKLIDQDNLPDSVEIGKNVSVVISQFLEIFTDKNSNLSMISEYCRSIGEKYYKLSGHVSADVLKELRCTLMEILFPANLITTSVSSGTRRKSVTYSSNSFSNNCGVSEKACIRLFNFAIREMKSAAICAQVEANRTPLKQVNSNKMLLENGTKVKKMVSLGSSEPNEIEKSSSILTLFGSFRANVSVGIKRKWSNLW
uniref:G_PROTEIN_RECEP_F1_2 domain-containing protein n=1 Tax=Rhabditophanes sp. KR3021 TaxID=114890 RepID=A0AC35TMU5_9BILA